MNMMMTKLSSLNSFNGRQIAKVIILLVVLQLIAIFMAINEHFFNDYLTVLIPTILLSMFLILACKDSGYDKTTIGLIELIVVIGIVLQYSFTNGSVMKGCIMQYVCFFGGLLIALTMLQMRKRLTFKGLYTVVCTLIVILYLILLLFGKTINGTKAWIFLLGNSLQLTDLTKLLTLYLMSVVFEEYCRLRLDNSFIIKTIMPVLAVNGLFLTVIHELGTLCVISLLFVVAVFIFCDLKFFLKMVLVITLLLVLVLGFSFLNYVLYERKIEVVLSAIFKYPYLRIVDRLHLLLHPETMNPLDEGYQVRAIKRALSVASFFGSPYNISVPVEGSDLIFVHIILEYGMIFAMIIFTVYVSILIKGIKIINGSSFDSTIVFFHLCLFGQGLYMMLSATGFGVLMGLPVPFLSSGGSAQLVSFTMLQYLLFKTREGLRDEYEKC